MTLAYSVRFRRCRPGGGMYGAAPRSSSFSSQAIERLVGRRVGPARARWRHHAGPHLPDDPFPDVRVRGDVRHVEVVERQLARRFLPGGFRGLAMARDAVAIEEGALRLNLGRTRR